MAYNPYFHLADLFAPPAVLRPAAVRVWYGDDPRAKARVADVAAAHEQAFDEAGQREVDAFLR